MDGMTYEEWRKHVESHLQNDTRFIGLSMDDLPDTTDRSYFDDGLSPEAAAANIAEDTWENFLNA